MRILNAARPLALADLSVSRAINCAWRRPRYSRLKGPRLKRVLMYRITFIYTFGALLFDGPYMGRAAFRLMRRAANTFIMFIKGLINSLRAFFYDKKKYRRGKWEINPSRGYICNICFWISMLRTPLVIKITILLIRDGITFKAVAIKHIRLSQHSSWSHLAENNYRHYWNLKICTLENLR